MTTKKNNVFGIINYILNFVYNKETDLFQTDEQTDETFDYLDFKHLKLQKILYFLFGFYYGKTKQELFDAEFIAYRYGPIIKPVYDKIKNTYVDEPLKNLEKDLFAKYSMEDLEMDRTVVNEILEKLLNFSTWRLVELSHLDGGPWDETKQSEVIDKAKILKYFDDAFID
ncbi:putative phage-associated protein [Mycoplasmoides fastidiosum]|uniref:Phage-associated protein n=1 Tax=Mycoplasmoides fastidiosum TaxID=92758 RepID=A0ABU0LYY1_9BACT|nr:type II toxin-antitoxin system antitoxin SocA domain-containing protein [Mycoplasmoides fastidiosum]MDQ0513899.1 putative phage-associated protein [Mycoplasmoides fastidiosum]UUD37687.1 DUF4065 domain-containing protein [Mycoplasmoides fastidiosum]